METSTREIVAARCSTPTVEQSESLARDGSAVQSETVAFSDEIQQEDIKICQNVQKGLQSRTYDTGRFSVKRENGVHHFHLLLNEFLTRE